MAVLIRLSFPEVCDSAEFSEYISLFFLPFFFYFSYPEILPFSILLTFEYQEFYRMSVS